MFAQVQNVRVVTGRTGVPAAAFALAATRRGLGGARLALFGRRYVGRGRDRGVGGGCHASAPFQ